MRETGAVQIWKLKKDAKARLRLNYVNSVAVGIIMVVFVGSYLYMSPSQFVGKTLPTNWQLPNSEIVSRFVSDISGEYSWVEGLSQSYSQAVTNGILANIFDNVTRSGSFAFGVLNSFNYMLLHGKLAQGAIVLLGAVLTFLYWLLFANVLRVGECRFFLESAQYEKTKPGRILFLFKIKRGLHVSKVMLAKALSITLWSITIIGGIYKFYCYRMVSYILAENPEISCKEVFALSTQMMKGNKLKAFLLDLSFLPLNILSVASLGVIGFLFANPYKAAATAELYRVLRQDALNCSIPFSSLLSDKYLTEFPAVLTHDIYPVHLYTIPEKESRKWISADCRKDYSLRSLVLLFFTYSVIGWLWEVGLMFFKDGIFADRGMLHGPWLPIYGCGGVLTLILLKKYLDKPALVFALATLISGIIEYFTSWVLELFFHTEWWDYSGYFLNIGGRICLEGLLVFSIAACISLYILSPVLDKVFCDINGKLAGFICIVLLVAFIGDFLFSSKYPNEGKDVTVQNEGFTVLS